MRKFWQALQLGWVTAIVVAGLAYIYGKGGELLLQQLGVLAWKLVLVGVAVAFAHVSRKQLFSYINLSEALQEKTQASAITFLAMALYYAAVILALCSGL